MNFVSLNSDVVVSRCNRVRYFSWMNQNVSRVDQRGLRPFFLPTIALAVVSLLAVVNCKKTVKSEDVESFIKKRVVALGLPSATAKCPKGVTAKVGSTFLCDVGIDGETYKLKVTVTKVGTDNLNMDTAWEKGEAIISTKLIPIAQSALSKELELPVVLACGKSTLVFIDAQRQVSCVLTADSVATEVKFTFDETLAIKTWKLNPSLLNRAKVEAALVATVAQKVGVVQVTCGQHAVVARPNDGKLVCEVNKAGEKRKITTEVTPELTLGAWQIE